MIQRTETEPEENHEAEPMDQKRTAINTVLGIVLVALIATAIFFLVAPDADAPVIEDTSTQTSTTVTPTITETTASPTASAITGTLYETDSLSLTISDGWTATEGTKEESTDPAASKRVPDPATVIVTQGNYTLTIDGDITPSGGPDGGRLADITQSIPSVEAVIKVQPGDCGTSESHAGFLPDHPRIDKYVSSTDATEGCNIPKDGPVWYFSYMGPGAINAYQNATNGVAITMSYTATDVNKLPSKSDPTLADMLTQMTSIVKTLKLKTASLAPVSSQ